jgi:hypothetical protein
MSDGANKSPRALLIGLAASLWLVIALVGYYYTHKPFTAEFTLHTLITLWRLLIVIGIISLSGGIGAWILSKRTSFSALTSIALQAALGSGILGLVTLLMGETIGFHPLYFAVLLLMPGILLRNYILSWIRKWEQLIAIFSKSGLVITLVLGTGLILLWTLATALAPPLHFDALTYHLALPRSYLLAGNMAYNPDNMFWGMPQQTEMLYTFAIALAGTETATALGWGLGLLTMIGLLGYVKERVNLTAAWAAVACLLAGQSLASSLAWGYTEWPVMLFGLGLIMALDTWRETSKRSYLLLAAAFAGFALGSKYTAGLLIPIGLAIIVWDGFRGHNRRVFINLLLFGGVAALVSLPWWVKNWLATSNPFYPLLFPSGAMTQTRLDYYSGAVWGSWLDTLVLPWQVTVWGVEGGQGFSSSIGPLLLGFGALSWIGWQARGDEEKRLLSTATIATLTGFVIWAVASRWNGLLTQTRLYAAFFPAWAILSGIGFAALTDLHTSDIRFGRIATAVLLLVFGFNLIEIGQEISKEMPFAVLDGSLTPTSYQTRNLGSYEKAMSALEALPSNAHVLMLWETRSLDCLPTCDPDEVIDRWYDDSQKYASVEEILAAWHAQGYAYLLLNVTGRKFVQENDRRITPESWNTLDTLLEGLPQPEMVAPGYELYQLDL